MKRMFLALTLLALVSCNGSVPTSSSAPTPSLPAAISTPMFAVTPLKPDVHVTSETTNGLTTFTIAGDSGIGGVTLARPSGEPWGKLRLNLKLRGLESFTLSYSGNEIRGSVSSTGSPTVTESVKLAGAGTEQEITATSEYWVPVAIVPPEQKIPLTNGYFQLDMPPAFYAANPSEFSIRWIDFYR